MRVPKPIGLSNNPPVDASVSAGVSHLGQEHKPKPIGLPQETHQHHAKAIGLSRGNSEHDAMLAFAIAQDPSLSPFSMRIKPRFAALAVIDDDGILNWGDRNLIALRTVTNDQAKIAGRLSQIDPSGWIDRCTNASCRPPTLMNKLFGTPETPAYYQTRIGQIRDELMAVIKDLRVLREEISPDVEDLRMDIAALQAFIKNKPAAIDTFSADNRLRILISGQQTVVMAVQAIDNMRQTCSQYICTIDQLLQVTIPNWLLATSRR